MTLFRCLFDIPKESSAIICLCQSPELLKNLERAESLGCRIFKPALSTKNISLQANCTTQVVRVVDHAQLGLFDLGVCLVKLVFVAKQYRQGVMNPKLFTIPVESGYDSKGRIEMVNRLLPLALGAIYLAKNPMRPAD